MIIIWATYMNNNFVILSMNVICLNPTCHRPGYTPHILDLVSTNKEGMMYDISYSSGLGASDHLCINFSLMCCPAPKHSTTRNQPYNLNKGDYAKLRNLLDMVYWSAEMEHLNTNESWNFLLAHLHKAISCSIPKYSIHI